LQTPTKQGVVGSFAGTQIESIIQP
jgi:hypothetical protein